MQTLPVLDDLEVALAFGTDARRNDILARITDLFVEGAPNYSEDQIGVFDEVMALLVRTIEVKARAKLAQRLAPIANAPANVIHLLAFDDEIEVARPVLTASPRVNEHTLIAAAGTKGQQHLFAISQRDLIGEAVTDILVERGDTDVVHEVAKNRGARFSEGGFRGLVERAIGDDTLASVLGMRADIPRPQLLVLLEQASIAVRARLVAENPQAAAAIDEVIAEVSGDFRDQLRAASPAFAEAVEAVGRQNRMRSIGEAEISHYARSGKFEETAIALSILCDTSIDAVERALLDPAAEIALILAKVANLSAPTTKAILLLRAAQRGMTTEQLDQAMASFERLQPDAARRVLSFFRARVKAPGADVPLPATVSGDAAA